MSVGSRALAGDFAPGEGVRAGAAGPDFDAGGWIDVPVPGDLHLALLAAGRISHPFDDRNEAAVAWMEEREWWYRMRMRGGVAPAGDERLRLVLHGLDTFATVYLNGEELGSHGNMFRPAAFDVSERVRPENLLAIRFDPPAAHVGAPLEGQWGPNEHARVWMRKAQYGYGWDWGPRLPTIGVWRPVELRRERAAALTGVRFATLRADAREALRRGLGRGRAARRRGRLTSTVAVWPPGGEEPVTASVPGGPAPCALRSRTRRCGGRTTSASRRCTGSRSRCCSTARRSRGTRARSACARSSSTSRPDPDEPGTRFFRFRLNGAGLFARGANWIPASSFLGAIAASATSGC